jgi:hypothetical protein
MGHVLVNTGKRKNKNLYGRERNKSGKRKNLTKYLTQLRIK